MFPLIVTLTPCSKLFLKSMPNKLHIKGNDCNLKHSSPFYHNLVCPFLLLTLVTTIHYFFIYILLLCMYVYILFCVFFNFLFLSSLVINKFMPLFSAEMSSARLKILQWNNQRVWSLNNLELFSHLSPANIILLSKTFIIQNAEIQLFRDNRPDGFGGAVTVKSST